MKFYLSSYKFGNESEKLKQMLPPGSKIGHINNARDFRVATERIKLIYQNEEINELNTLGFLAEPLDLREYFGRNGALKARLNDLNGLWVSGGNTFVLRQAMKLSGFDRIFQELKMREDFLYGGYSAGVCVLCDSLKYIQSMDDPYDFPYAENNETVWEGLGVFNYGILPHYETESMSIEVQMCIENKWLFVALRDGEVIMMNKQ